METGWGTYGDEKRIKLNCIDNLLNFYKKDEKIFFAIFLLPNLYSSLIIWTIWAFLGLLQHHGDAAEDA